MAGGLLAGIFSKKLKPAASPFLLVGCAFSLILGGAALQVLNNPMQIYIVLTIGCGIFMVLASLFSVQMMAYLQIMTPKNLIGKVISCVMCLCMCSNPLGQFAYGFIFEKLGHNLYLLFYIAPLLVIGIGVMTRHIFYEVEQLIGEDPEEVVSAEKAYIV